MQWSSLGVPALPVRSRLLPGMTGLLLDTFSLLGEVAVGRTRLGRRYLTIFGVAAGYAVLIGLPLVVVGVFIFFFSSVELGLLGALFAVAMGAGLGANGTVLFTAFTWAFLGRAIYLLVEGDYRRRAGDPIPTTYSGCPSPLWNLIPFGPRWDEGHIKRYGEPLLLLGVAWLLYSTDLLLALYLGTSGIAMFVKSQLEHRLLSHQAADLDDQVFDSAGLSSRFGGPMASPQPHGVAQSATLATGPNGSPAVPAWLVAAQDAGAVLNAPFPPTVTALDDGNLPSAEPPVVETKSELPPAPVAESTSRRADTTATVRVKVRCPHCGQVGRVPFRQGLRRMRCHGCDQQFETTLTSAQ